MSADHAANQPSCRFCGQPLTTTFVDLGKSPLCESFLEAGQLNAMEPFYPLHVWVCGGCFLVQLEEYVSPEDIFTHYAYFSSYSTSWLDHARRYTEMAIERFGLGADSLVVELASNDGYLLQYFVERGVPVLGVEPAKNVAEAAIERGVPTLTEFFGVECARRLSNEGKRPQLVIGNNVLAQVPDINDFVGGMAALLADGGVVTMEFPHLVRLVEGNQFDTIYHEHFSYFSLVAVERIFSAHGLTVFDVEEVSTHGGSLRIFARHTRDESRPLTDRVTELAARERSLGLEGMDYYAAFAARVMATKRRLLSFLIEARERGKTVAGYGAPGKGNTLLNYCGIRTDLLEYTVDRNPFKHGRFLPGTHIPIHAPERIAETRPDYILILPWNLRAEIVEQLAYAREWGAKFVVPIPEVTIYD
jgi:hypothetical protein